MFNDPVKVIFGAIGLFTVICVTFVVGLCLTVVCWVAELLASLAGF